MVNVYIYREIYYSHGWYGIETTHPNDPPRFPPPTSPFRIFSAPLVHRCNPPGRSNPLQRCRRHTWSTNGSSTCGFPEVISHWTKHSNHPKRTSCDPSAHIHQFFGGGRNSVSLSMATTLGSNISPSQNTFESMIFLFPFGGICDPSLESIFVTLGRVGGLYPPGVTPFQKMFQVLV